MSFITFLRDKKKKKR